MAMTGVPASDARRLGKLMTLPLFLTLLFGYAPSAFAQARIVGAINGTVRDSSGAAAPNAKVVLKDEGTGIAKETTTNADGEFVFSDLSMGFYEVSVSAPGFQTAVYQRVQVQSSKTTDLIVELRVGAVTESMNVTAAAPVLETTSNVISRTVDQESVASLPPTGGTRSTLAFARLVPGQATPLGTGDTHYNGTPGGAINVTFDGINNASNGFKSGGTSFYATVPPRLGAVEEITVETGGLGADSGAQSGANLKFVTKRGTNQYHGSLFEQARNEAFNANSWINNAQGRPRTRLRQHEFGGNLGGPLIPIRRWGLKEKLFFFFNFEDQYQPQSPIYSHPVLLPEAQQGIFRYQTATGAILTANVFDIARQNGFPTTPDPIIVGILAQQNKALQNGYVTPLPGNLRQQTLNWVEPNNINDYFATTRLDYQITPNLAWTGTWNLRHSWNPGRRQWPLPENLPQYQFRIGGYWIYSMGLNWTITPKTLNEFRYGVQHSGDTTPNTGPKFYDVNGRKMRLTFPYLTPMVNDQAPITGRHYIATIYDTATFIRGNHTIRAGGSYRRTDWKDAAEAGGAGILGVPQFNVGLAAGDPAASIFNATTLPGIQSNDIGNAANLYALLMGRLVSVRDGRTVDPATLRYGGPYNITWTRNKQGGFFAQDQWRIKSNLTLNFGLRWELQGDPFNVNGITAFPNTANLYGPSMGLFQPGVLSGITDPINVVGKHAAMASLANLAPNFGFAWNPKFEDGILGTLTGHGKTVLRGGYSLVYYDEGTQFFATTAGNNPGKLQTLTLQAGQGSAPYGLTLQSPLPDFTAFPPEYVRNFHQADFTFSNTFSTMKPNLRTPYVHNWDFGFQRELAKNTVIEVRYVGTKSRRGWRTYNLNEVNIFENGFLAEFKNAQNNLAINAANGFPNDFANRNLPGQAPLPILQAAFGARGSQPALAAGSGFSNGAFVNALQTGQAGAMAQTLATSSQYVCRMFGNTFLPCTRFGFDAAGLYPLNFFLTNPFSAGALNYVDDSAYSNYHGMQVNLRRQYSGGLSVQANYTVSKNLSNTWADNQNQSVNYQTLRNRRLDKAPAPFDLRQVFTLYGTYELPLGKKRWLATNHRILDTIIGGWTMGGILTLQSGNVFRLGSGRATVNNQDSGVILLNGITPRDLQNMTNISQGPVTNRYWFDPKLIGPDGRANPQYLGTPTTPGVFGSYIYLYGKNHFNLDVSLIKNFRITERLRLNFWVGAQNVLNHPVWNAANPPLTSTASFLSTVSIQSTTFGQTTAPANGARSVQLRTTLSF